jgi:hypothetical protein
VAISIPTAGAQSSEASSYAEDGVRITFAGWTRQPLDTAGQIVLKIHADNADEIGVFRECRLTRQTAPVPPGATQHSVNAQLMAQGRDRMAAAAAEFGEVLSSQVGIIDGVAVVDVETDASATGGPVRHYSRFFTLVDGASVLWFHWNCAAMSRETEAQAAEMNAVVQSLQFDRTS